MDNIRNFVILSHVDHGKSTLADRLLEITETVPPQKMREQFLDAMDLEREKGITIKMQPCRMRYLSFLLNLIDTPGHVDFSYEVSRSLAAVEGAILLVDATKGIQAQTISNFELAKSQGLVIIPAVNKIDSPQAQIEEAKRDLAQLTGISIEEIFSISAKRGDNVKDLLEAVILKVPPPKGKRENDFQALVFDSKYDAFKGIIAYIRVVEGEIKKGERICLIQQGVQAEVKDIGYFAPQLTSFLSLTAGQIGYLATGIKEPGLVRVGETVARNLKTSPLPGYKEAKPVVFASIYPESPDDFENLKVSLARLKLNDASFTFEPETKESLGRGFRCGFLGSLHAEIISERLKREFVLNLIISTPSVVFKGIDQKNKEFFIYSPSDWPNAGETKELQEPWVRVEVISPVQYFGKIIDLLEETRGKQEKVEYFGGDKAVLTYEVPFKGIITGFYDNLKGVSQGMASMDYSFKGYKKADLVKLDILIAGEKEEAFSKIVYEDSAEKEGRKIVSKLKETMPPQLFSVSLQAAVSGRILARETIRAKGKDVIAPLYGGDYTRKRKLLEKQKKGKKKLKEKGRVRVPSKVFLDMFKA